MTQPPVKPPAPRADPIVAADSVPHPIRSAWRIDWTDQADCHLTQMRRKGDSLRAIATAFGLSRQTIAQRATELGLHLPVKRETVLPGQSRPMAPDHFAGTGRDPFPAGHPLCWSLITDGTCLEGTDYVIPANSRLRRPNLVSA